MIARQSKNEVWRASERVVGAYEASEGRSVDGVTDDTPALQMMLDAQQAERPEGEEKR